MNDIFFASETERSVADSALEFARGSGGVQRARTLRDRSPQFDGRIWQQVVRLGWLGMLVPEELGGSGLDAQVTAALAESLGRVLLPEPVIQAMAAANFLSTCAKNGPGSLLEQLLAGKLLCAFARANPGSSDSELRFSHIADCYDGTRILAACGDGVTFSVRELDHGVGDTSWATVSCVDGSILTTCVVSRRAWDDAAVVVSGPVAQAAFEHATDVLRLGYAAYLVGLTHEALQMALDFMKIRSQFGTPIGTFQALQHRAATCYVEVAASRALVHEAAGCFRSPTRARAVAAAKAKASAAALHVTKECVQFHGAMGFADEHDIGLYLRKAMTFASRLGGQAQQIARFAQLTRGA